MFNIFKGLQFFLFVLFMFVPGVSSSVILDPESAQCMGCHDAAIATDVTLQICSELDCDHPIGMDYAMLASYNNGLTSPFSLPPSIKLIGNSIGCGTCHIPYDKNHAVSSSLRRLYPQIADPMLVMDNRQSELCFSCHVK